MEGSLSVTPTEGVHDTTPGDPENFNVPSMYRASDESERVIR